MGNCILTRSYDNQLHLLWTNINPTSNFDAQTVSVDLSAYNWVWITARIVSDSDYFTSAYCRVGDSATLVAQRQDGNHMGALFARLFSVSSTSIIFQCGGTVATYGMGVNSPEVCIPYQICGII